VDSYLALIFRSTVLHMHFMPITCYFSCYGSGVYFEFGYCDTSCIALFCSILPWLLVIFVLPGKLQGWYFNHCVECHWNFDGDCIEHVNCFW
jgi:hypothetical protein